MMDQVVASHLNGQAPNDVAPAADHLGSCFDDATGADDADDASLAFYSTAANRLLGSAVGSSGAGSDNDLWSFTQSSASVAAAAATSTTPPDDGDKRGQLRGARWGRRRGRDGAVRAAADAERVMAGG